MPGGRGSSLGCGPGGRLWSAISRTLMTLLGRRTRVVVPIAIVRLVSFFGRPGDLHRLADRPRGPTISLRSSANRAWLEGLKVWMQSGAVCTPPVSGATERGELPSPQCRAPSTGVASPGGSSTAVVTTPSTTSAKSGGMQPALLRDQTVDISLDEILVAIDARSAWTCRPVA
jgi:hypothetical protein